eukprot:6124140-Pleurochrysis_carterae.AAC.1
MSSRQSGIGSVLRCHEGRMCTHRQRVFECAACGDEEGADPHGRLQRVVEEKVLHQRDEDDAAAAQQHPHRRVDVQQPNHHQHLRARQGQD